MEKAIFNRVCRIIKDSKNLVCITGQAAVTECGSKDLWDDDNFYRIEKAYNMSPEELLSAGEYATRKERFYEFYKKEVIDELPKPGKMYESLKRLEKLGILKKTISLNIFGLEKKAGLEEVVELCGSVYSNMCDVCHTNYTVDYLRKTVGVPKCEKCKTPIRPKIRLCGEKVQNDMYTEALTACSEADTIIVLGCNLHGSKIRYCTGHYKGHNLILINEEDHFCDVYADYCLHGRCDEILPMIVENL